MWKESTRWHKVLGGIGLLALLITGWAAFIYQDPGDWRAYTAFAITVFFLSIVVMDAMSYRDDLKARAALSKLSEAEKKELPLADRIALVSPEPLGVLDRHEIRRSLIITLTVVYLIVLFLSIFKGSAASGLSFKDNPLVDGLRWAFLTALSFYFGSRALEEALKTATQKGGEKKNNGGKDPQKK